MTPVRAFVADAIYSAPQHSPSPHRQHRELVDQIERECPVHDWRGGDVDLWPIVSQDLFLDLFRASGANTAAGPPTFPVRAATSLATPAANIWKSRRDLRHWVWRPKRADALLLGDGLSLDFVRGSWRDRFGEGVVAELERQGRSCFVMQSGNLERLPWARPTFPANRVAARAALVAGLRKVPLPQLPDHDVVMRLLARAPLEAPSLSRGRLARRANIVAAQASEFERILKRVRPKMAFVVTYYAGLGNAFALACRRLGILCIDLQHCPHDDNHRAYRWSKIPAKGYSTLPGLFWTWSEDDAANIRRWTDAPDQPWHRTIVGGHAQISALAECDADWNRNVLLAKAGANLGYEREILIALQPIGGRREVWSALAALIQNAPTTWRWWIRRHPASTTSQDDDYTTLLTLVAPNVVTGPEAQAQLPILLGHMDVLVSLASGAAAEAAMFGVPAFFLDDEARGTFPSLLASGGAAMIPVSSLVESIARLPARRLRQISRGPPLADTLAKIDRLAADYAALCREGSGLTRS